MCCQASWKAASCLDTLYGLNTCQAGQLQPTRHGPEQRHSVGLADHTAACVCSHAPWWQQGSNALFCMVHVTSICKAWQIAATLCSSPDGPQPQHQTCHLHDHCHRLVGQFHQHVLLKASLTAGRPVHCKGPTPLAWDMDECTRISLADDEQIMRSSLLGTATRGPRRPCPACYKSQQTGSLQMGCGTARAADLL